MFHINSIKIVAISAIASALLVGCGSNSDTTPSSGSLTPISGVAIDPELQGAQVFLDANENGQFDAGELETLTDANGSYTLDIPSQYLGKPLVVSGGIDKVTKEKFQGQLMGIAQEGANTQHITPLSTLVAKMKLKNSTRPLDTIKQEVAAKLGINAEDLDKNIMKEGNEKLLKLALRVHKVAKKIAAVNNQEERVVYDALVTKLQNAADIDTALGETIKQEVASGTLKEAQVKDLDKELKNIPDSLKSQELALTVDNIEKTIDATKNESELSKDLANDDTIQVTSQQEQREHQAKKALEALGLEKLDATIQDKIKNSDKIDFANDTLEVIQNKIETKVGLTAQELAALKREQLFAKNGLNDLDTTTREDLKQKFENDGFDFKDASEEDFKQKLQDDNFLGNDENFKSKIQAHETKTEGKIAPNGSNIVGSIIKGPIDGAVIKLKDNTGKLLSSTVSEHGLFSLPQVDLNASYYTLESIGGSYEDEATKQRVTIADTQGLKTFFTKSELQTLLAEKKFVAMTPESTIYAEVVEAELANGADLAASMADAKKIITDAMITNSSPMPGLQGDAFLTTGNFTLAFPKDQTQAFARNRAIAFSYMVRDLNLSAQKVFDVMTLVAQDYADGVADGVTLSDGRDVNITEVFSMARTKLFQDTTAKLREGNLSDGQKEQLKQMGFDVEKFGNKAHSEDANLSAVVDEYLSATNLPTLHILPQLQDEDGNATDAKATYTLRAMQDVNVTIETPTGSWVTPMWRYNNSALPVVIRTDRGTKMTLNFDNNLSADSTIHWHGFKIPAIMDGGPDLPVAPNSSKVYSFTMDQPAAPLWFHPHPDMQTGKQVYMGLAGVYLLEDNISKTLEINKELPSGDKDTVLLVQDRRFSAQNNGVKTLAYKDMPMDSDGMYGDTILVNGSVMPKQEVSNTLHRYRLYNVSNARTYDFALSDGSDFMVVGTDGGLLEKPVQVNHIMLGAAERVEIVIDFSKYQQGSKVALISKPFNGDMMGMMGNNSSSMGSGMGSSMDSNGDTMTNHEEDNGMQNRAMDTNTTAQAMPANGQGLAIMRFDITTEETEDITLYTQLPANAEVATRLREADANNVGNEREFVMSMGGMGSGMQSGGNQGMSSMSFVINGKTFDMNRVDEFVPAGATEIWSIKNMSPMAHPFHAHAIQYQILTRNGKPATGTDLGLKDTFLVQPGETVRIIGDFSSAKGDYMYHCHILEHEDAGMMGYFRVGDTGNVNTQP